MEGLRQRSNSMCGAFRLTEELKLDHVATPTEKCDHSGSVKDFLGKAMSTVLDRPVLLSLGPIPLARLGRLCFRHGEDNRLAQAPSTTWLGAQTLSATPSLTHANFVSLLHKAQVRVWSAFDVGDSFPNAFRRQPCLVLGRVRPAPLIAIRLRAGVRLALPLPQCLLVRASTKQEDLADCLP